MMEVNAQPEPAIGPILDRFFTQQIMEMVLDWAIQVPDFLKPTCQICTKLAEDRTLLHFFFSCAEGADQFMVFSLLIPYLYEQNDVGQLARDALLLILSVSATHEQIAEFVAYKVGFLSRSVFCSHS
ncbi:unnamed protein product [Nippostrongylus brasiliensis]|uniref:UPF0518 protein (inferred by orthology to a C. elegans protein) n=1 Tax=Nippostrongylus brasiliensis TaxID=27835 RepID=A0A0N4YWA9_NIPBR|nr:unnamed protein product [Nippostrongylus brasiliensis]